MQYKCKFCQDTGSLTTDYDSYNCVNCNVVEHRLALDAWLEDQYKNGLLRRIHGLDAWNIYRAALAMAPKQEAPAQEPVAYLRFRAAQQWSGMGGHDIEHCEWLETCQAHEVGDDKLPAFPVYAAPAAANGAPGYAEKASPIAITDSSALNGIKWYVPPPEHLRNGMQLYFVAPQPVAAAGPDAAPPALELAAEQLAEYCENMGYESSYVDDVRAALSGAKGN